MMEIFNKNENILDRIKTIANNEGITITALEKKIGASKGVLSRAITNRTDIQYKWVQFIVENYPLYSTEWLLTGQGSMLKEKPDKSISNVKGNFSGNIGNVNGSGEDVYKLLKDKDAQIKDKDAQINKLLEQISKLIEIIGSK